MKTINENQTFETIQENSGNCFALAALKTVIKDKNYFNPLYIYGEEGSGKTHLLNATINSIPEQSKVVFLSADTLSVEIVDHLTVSEFDYILIDDLNLLPKDTVLEEKLAVLIGANSKQLVFMSSVAPKDLDVCGRLQDRLQWGLTTNITSEK